MVGSTRVMGLGFVTRVGPLQVSNSSCCICKTLGGTRMWSWKARPVLMSSLPLLRRIVSELCFKVCAFSDASLGA